MPSIPITIITGFLGSGKTTLLLNILPQILAKNPKYKTALLKNEFGDLAVDSQLAGSSITGVREILNGCICCNLVGSLSTALEELTESISPDRIVIETSGSAFPATLAMEVNRLARETEGKYVLDGVVTVIDVENWKGYEDTSFTARLQARYTDLVVFNKWEDVDERRWDECLDRLGDIEVEIPWVKSQRGFVDMDIIFGLDGGLARELEGEVDQGQNQHKKTHKDGENHQNEVEVLSVTLSKKSDISSTITRPNSDLTPKVDTDALLKFLQTAPKDEIYRIKSIFTSSTPMPSSTPIPSLDLSETPVSSVAGPNKYILNWSFGRWTCTPMFSTNSPTSGASFEHPSSEAVGQGEVFLRMIIILSRGAGRKWKKRLEEGGFVRFEDTAETDVLNLSIVPIS
ncbi:putative GTP-binding protein YjiA [Golovinomyces cichoracearum]|uniref:Putative GTP-binding protein YjiA n=1 Tax=Golovinomyces cichoracearum TaxID=62708 RepID=A0A420IKL8_9PEZI|nr:putative GTP-binding protein YjiA [Golovinomyces cichoracearum]